MVQAKRWQRAPSSATSTFPQAGQKSSITAAPPSAARARPHFLLAASGSASGAELRPFPGLRAMATEAAPPEEEEEAEAAHAEVLALWQAALARLVTDPLLCDLPAQVGAWPLGAWPEPARPGPVTHSLFAPPSPAGDPRGDRLAGGARVRPGDDGARAQS